MRPQTCPLQHNMTILSDLPLARLFEAVGKEVTIADKSHFFFGLRGTILSVRDSIPSGSPDKPSQIVLMTPEVVIGFPLIDGLTGKVEDARLLAKTTQVALALPKTPFRPHRKPAPPVSIDYSER